MSSPGAIGQVVILNGASSAGKSSVAQGLQRQWEQRGECWLIFGWDDFVPRIPSRWHSGPEGVGELSEAGITYQIVSAPDEPLSALLVTGTIGRQIINGYHRAIAALALSGVNVLVEEVLISADEWSDWNSALREVSTTWVALRSDVEVVVRRERDRGDRYVGLARGTSAVVHEHVVYDIDVDTTSRTVVEVVEAIDDALRPVT